jgi:hypothetical protein
MKTSVQKLAALQLQLKKVISDAETGKIDKAKAAEKIIELRDSMDQIVKDLQAKH